LAQVLADEKSAHLLVTEPVDADTGTELVPGGDRVGGHAPFSPVEWFVAHVLVFLIGVWNLLAINLARTPETWWFWIPAAAWAVLLVAHAASLMIRSRRAIRPVVVIRREGGAR
jgi:hypothetical protein